VAVQHLIQESSKLNASANCDDRKWAVCIVGQLSRLESATKMANVLRAFAREKRAGIPDAFVVMETKSHAYINKGSIASHSDTCQDDFHSPEEVEDLFRPFYKGGLYAPHKKYTPNPKYWGRYGFDKNIPRAERLSAHFAQWTHIAACSELVKQHEHITGCKYQAVLKLRDNSIAVKPFNVVEALEYADASVLVKRCDGWGGLSDKVMFAPRKYLEAAFEAPLKVARKVDAGSNVVNGDYVMKDVENPEGFLKTVLELYKCPFSKSDSLLPFVDGRCLGEDGRKQRKWCLVEQLKDCRPRRTTGFSTCPNHVMR